MQIAHAKLHMCTNIMYKFQSSTCKTVGEKLRTKLCPQTDGQTDRQTDGQPWRFQYTPPPLRCGGGGGIKITSINSNNLPKLEVRNLCFKTLSV